MSIESLAKQNLFVKPVAQALQIIQAPKENIALINATEGEISMNNKNFYSAVMAYKSSMKQAKTLFEKGYISSDDYTEIDTILSEKYGLGSCSIYAENELINS